MQYLFKEIHISQTKQRKIKILSILDGKDFIDKRWTVEWVIYKRKQLLKEVIAKKKFKDNNGNDKDSNLH